MKVLRQKVETKNKKEKKNNKKDIDLPFPPRTFSPLTKLHWSLEPKDLLRSIASIRYKPIGSLGLKEDVMSLGDLALLGAAQKFRNKKRCLEPYKSLSQNSVNRRRRPKLLQALLQTRGQAFLPKRRSQTRGLNENEAILNGQKPMKLNSY